MFMSMGLRHLVIVDEDLNVVGILTRKDFQDVDLSWNAGRALEVPEPKSHPSLSRNDDVEPPHSIINEGYAEYSELQMSSLPGSHA